MNGEERGVKQQLVVLPTGAGKTVVFAELLKARPGSVPALVLAHREELLIQAKEKIQHANPDLRVEIEQGPNKAGTVDVVVGSVPSLGRSDSRRLEAYPRDYFRVIICDEAHHSAAASYKRVFDYFNRPDQLRLGVTATPQRGDNVGLNEIYSEVVYFKSIEDLIDQGYLCKLRGFRVESSCDISSVGQRAGDYIDSQLAQVINTPERNALVVESYQKLVPGSKCLVFASTVQHGKNIATAFAEAGIAVGYVFGSTGHDDRRHILDRFRRASGSDSSIEVMVNCGVLTEGFDFPGIESIITARPTRSTLLYTQCIGRGTRLSPGKDYCTIIDVADITRSKKPYGLPSLLGLPSDFDVRGGDLMETAGKFHELERLSPSEASRVRSAEDIEVVYKQIDIFRPPPPSEVVLAYSTFIWAEVGPDNYYLGISAQESLHISRDPLGSYSSVLRGKDKRPRTLGTCSDIREAFARSDRWVLSNRKSQYRLLDSRSIWRSDSPTDKQVKWLKKFGVPITNEMTKGEASQILDKLFAENPPKKKPEWLEKKIQANKSKNWF